ncbi:M23 family metallopeptidase [Pedosphaera parvula]|uniref:Peptidase M23 n=1 Tax=Pedosphaera parvula (strain Ellin514) TaxID=320771 RepID=B9XDQ4_PEDPL|nr:M23 family metallopeptidase [Pedosphaera parvula]EEF62200.1 Peptidase M23 [Pedosphaera parvula Ellin514]
MKLSRTASAVGVLILAFILNLPLNAQNFGGGPPQPFTDNCIPAHERQQIELNISRSMARLGLAESILSNPPALYPFVPIAGTVWDDRFINNFVDLNTSSGIQDWDCTDFTYDGHQGHDIDLRSFGEQDVGVPVFAALDGTVVDWHDGEFDKNTSMGGQPANYVVIFHGGTHYTWYYHLRNGSIAVTNGQVLKAGTQVGLAASSGNSTGPHLHFESRFNNTFYEPSAGTCRPGTTGWVHQIPIRRDMWIEDFAMHNTNNFPDTAFFPYNPVRTGTFVRTGSFQPIGAWYIIHNQPANSTWRLRYLRPNGTLFFDSGTNPHNNATAYRYASWWVYYNLTPDIAGTWTFELSINGQVMVQAPFFVLNAGGVPVNHVPNPIGAAFDPVAPTTNDVVFCRLTIPLIADPDFDLMRNRFQWSINGAPFRDVTNAAHADAIPRGAAKPGDLLRCTVTPYDGLAFGTPVTVQALVPGGTPMRLGIQRLPANPNLQISWPTSALHYALQANSNLSTSNWSIVTNAPVVSGTNNVVTNSVQGSRFYRLIAP